MAHQAKLVYGDEIWWTKQFTQRTPNKGDGSAVDATFSNHKVARVRMIWWGVLKPTAQTTTTKPTWRMWKRKKKWHRANNKASQGCK